MQYQELLFNLILPIFFILQSRVYKIGISVASNPMRVLDNFIMCGMESARIVWRCFFLSERSRLCSDNVPIMFRYALWSFSGVFRGRNGGYSEGYSEMIYAKNGQFYRLDGSDSAG